MFEGSVEIDSGLPKSSVMDWALDESGFVIGLKSLSGASSIRNLTDPKLIRSLGIRAAHLIR